MWKGAGSGKDGGESGVDTEPERCQTMRGPNARLMYSRPASGFPIRLLAQAGAALPQ